MADPLAQALVQGLRAQGWSVPRIAAALGRDPGLVYQINRGARSAGYGAAFVPALRSMAFQLPAPPTPRREQRLRKPAVTLLPGEARHVQTRGPKLLRQQLESAARRRDVVNFTIHAENILDYSDEPDTLDVYENGYDAAEVLRILDGERWDGTTENMGQILAAERHVHLSGVRRIEMRATKRIRPYQPRL
jgi:hypothetical protein